MRPNLPALAVWLTYALMSHVLHLHAASADLQTRLGVRCMVADASRHSAATVRTIGPGGDYPHWLWAVLNLRGSCGGFDVVHAWDETSFHVARAAGAKRMVFTAPGGFTRADSLRMSRLLRNDRVTVVFPSAAQAGFLRGAPTTHVAPPPISNPIANASDRVATRASLGLSPDDFALLTPGESTRGAAHEVAVWTTSILHVVDERYRLIVWGRGPRVEAARRLGDRLRQPGLVVVAEQPGENRVEFESLLPAADALLLTARGPLPATAVALAMSAGVPVVGAARPELADLVIDNQTAWTTAALSPRLMARRLLDLREDPAAADRIARHARDHVRDHCDPAKFQKIYAAIYAFSAASRNRPSFSQPAIAG